MENKIDTYFILNVGIRIGLGLHGGYKDPVKERSVGRCCDQERRCKQRHHLEGELGRHVGRGETDSPELSLFDDFVIIIMLVFF